MASFNIPIHQPSVKWAIVLSSGFCILLLGYCVLIKNLSQQLATAKKQQTVFKQTLLNKQYIAKKLPLKQKQVQDLRLTLLAQVNHNDLNKLSELSAQAGIHLFNVKALPEQVNNNLVITPVEIIAASNYQQLQRFIDLIRQAKPLLGITDFVIDKYKINLIINMYGQLNPTKTSVVNQQLDPFYSAENVLESFPLHALHMVGVMRQDKKTWALLTAPDGKLYSITVGTHLDNEGRVVQVDADKIVVIKNNKTIILSLLMASKS
jgi:Tfp pilus assembly protein PilO